MLRKYRLLSKNEIQWYDVITTQIVKIVISIKRYVRESLLNTVQTIIITLLGSEKKSNY